MRMVITLTALQPQCQQARFSEVDNQCAASLIIIAGFVAVNEPW